jgi:hypothetical protein
MGLPPPKITEYWFMKNVYESSSLLMHLQGLVSSSAETSNYTSAYDLKSVVLPHEVVWL